MLKNSTSVGQSRVLIIPYNKSVYSSRVELMKSVIWDLSNINVWCPSQEPSGGSCSRNDISHTHCFQVIYCWDAFGSLVELLGGLWALYFENKSPFSPRYEWQVGIEAEPSKVCFVHQLSECVRLPPLTNGNKTDKSPYMVFDNIFEGLRRPGNSWLYVGLSSI